MGVGMNFALLLLLQVQLALVACHAQFAAPSQSSEGYQWEAWMDPSLPAPHSAHHILHKEPPVDEDRRRMLRSAELTPLFPGYGTHYVYAYVGTPPQRQSLIVDTGSHYTAFPCTGCSQCGKHTDPYFDVKNSSTASIPKCLNNQQCLISQSYTEGSSWHGYKVRDKLWIGGIGNGLLPGAELYAINFEFGCQTSETGLFRTQLADGIMGMSASEDTLPHQLFLHNVTESRIFSLCFRIGGGMMTLGGVDQHIHTQKTVNYARLYTRAQGLYGVRIRSIGLMSVTGETSTVNERENILNGGDKGVILDSGTTDTYFPEALAKAFGEAFKKASGGVTYASGTVSLTTAQLSALPSIVVDLESNLPNKTTTITLPMSSYVDSVGDGKYTFRVYFSEKQGAVLGANFMNNYNVIFDVDGKRLGFAKSNCNYAEFAPVVTHKPSAAPTKVPGTPDQKEDDCSGEDQYTPYTQCTARCDRNESAYTAVGNQDFISKCKPNVAEIVSRPCEESCSFYKSVRGDPRCPDTEWSECTHACIMSRFTVPLTEPLYQPNSRRCNYRQQTATCYTGMCPRREGDYLIYLDMRVRLEPYRWSYLYTEAFFAAFTQIFKLKGNAIELLNNAGNEYTPSTKLHFQIRLKASGYKDGLALHDAAEKIIATTRDSGFSQLLVSVLDSLTINGNPKQSRFGWLFAQDVEVLSAVAIPIGDTRGPYVDTNGKELAEESATKIQMRDMLLIGVALGALLVLFMALYSHYRLRQEYALISKDKSSLAKSTQALRKLWSRFATMSGRPSDVNGANSRAMGDSLSMVELQREMEHSRMGLMESEDEGDFGEEGYH